MNGRLGGASMRGMLRRVCNDRGQVAAEYLGVLLLVAALVVALMTTGVGSTIAGAIADEIECIVSPSTCRHGGSGGGGSQAGALRARLDALAGLAARGGVFADLDAEARAALGRGDLAAADRALKRLEYYDGFVKAGPRGGLLGDLNSPGDTAFDALAKRGDIYLDGGRTSRRFFRVPPQPGRGVVALDFFIPDANSDGFRGDNRPEAGTNVLRSDLGVDKSRVMVVIDYETGRAVVTQTETNLDIHGVGYANEPRPTSINGDRGQWAYQGGLDVDETNQLNVHSDAGGVRLSWDMLNSISPLVVSVDGDVTLTEGADGFLHTGDFGNQGKVDRYPEVQAWQYLPDGREREIGRNDYNGGHNPVIGALPHCDLPNLPNLPAIGIGGHNIFDLPNLPNLPSVPGPCGP